MSDKRREPKCTNNHDAQRRELARNMQPPRPCPNCGWELKAMGGARPVGIVSIELNGASYEQLKDVTEWLVEQFETLHRKGVLLSGVEDNFGHGVEVESIISIVRVEV